MHPRVLDKNERMHWPSCFCRKVCFHVICGAVDERDDVIDDDLPDKVVANVDVFCVGVAIVVVTVGKLDGSLPVAVPSDLQHLIPETHFGSIILPVGFAIVLQVRPSPKCPSPCP